MSHKNNNIKKKFTKNQNYHKGIKVFIFPLPPYLYPTLLI